MLLQAPDGDSLKAKRDRAIVAVYLFHALRRSELADWPFPACRSAAA